MNALNTHSVVDLAESSYSIGSSVQWSLPPECDVGLGIVPAVVFGDTNLSWTAEGVKAVLDSFAESDDVYQPAFSQGGFLIARSDGTDAPTLTLDETLTKFLNENSSKLIFVSAGLNELPDGPYFVKGRDLHRAWRLFPDENLAFTLALAPSENGDPYTWAPLRAGAYSGLYPVVAVPSRLHYPKRADKPLNGMRFTVKDNYHLSGGPQNQTSHLVKRLVEQGAVILGKTKLGAYAGSEVPPEKCIDYFAPWNPRGDGYQGPSGSSSGAGSSVASYPWVDIALGTDTTGSIRMPAASYGLWGLRATHKLFPLEGIMPAVPAFDTLGVLTRNPLELRKLLDISRCSPADEDGPVIQGPPKQAPLTSTTGRPSNIVIPTDWFPMKNPGQQKMVDEFTKILEEKLGINVLKLSFEGEWAKTGPKHLRSKTLLEYLDKSLYWPNYYDGYHSYDGFRDDFKAKFGHEPYTSPFMTKRWGLSTDITESQRKQGLDELQVYYDWVHTHILNPYNFVLLPLGRPGANYRGTLPSSGPGAPSLFSESAYDPIDFCTVLGLPQLVVPIGQNPYESRVTGRTEYAPIVASLAGPRGSDDDLLELAMLALKTAGWPIEVLTGATSFVVGHGDGDGRNVAPDEPGPKTGTMGVKL